MSTAVNSCSKAPASRSQWMLANLRRVFPASLVVFLVALPLSLGSLSASGPDNRRCDRRRREPGIVTRAVGGSPVRVNGGRGSDRGGRRADPDESSWPDAVLI